MVPAAEGRFLPRGLAPFPGDSAPSARNWPCLLTAAVQLSVVSCSLSPSLCCTQTVVDVYAHTARVICLFHQAPLVHQAGSGETSSVNALSSSTTDMLSQCLILYSTKVFYFENLHD